MNPHPVLETETPCLWCDGTGLHLYAAYADRSRVHHCPLCSTGDDWRPCAACYATGKKQLP